LEKRLNGKVPHSPVLHVPDHGIWRGEDFEI
jgi:hypothetical protein